MTKRSVNNAPGVKAGMLAENSDEVVDVVAAGAVGGIVVGAFSKPPSTESPATDNRRISFN